MDSRWVLGDFERAFGNLKDALAVPVETDLEKAGCIQYFEFCFELAWKSVQALARDGGWTMKSCGWRSWPTEIEWRIRTARQRR